MLKKNRWLINGILIIATLAFVGFLILPIFEAVQGGSSGATPSPSASAASPVARQADLEAQVRGYEAVLQREPDNQTALRGLLEARIQLGDLKGAIEPLEKLASLNPDQPDYKILLAQAKQRLGDREGAAESYRNILATQPGNLKALQGLAALMLQQNRPQAAIGLLQDTIKNADEANKIQTGSVDVTSVRLLLAGVYAEADRYDEAIALYNQVTENNPQDFRPVLGKAMVLQQQGKQEEAAPLFTSAKSLAPAELKDQINQLAAGASPAPVSGTGTEPGVAPSPTASSAEPSP